MLGPVSPARLRNSFLGGVALFLLMVGTRGSGAELDLLSQAEVKAGESDPIVLKREVASAAWTISVMGNSQGTPGVGLTPSSGEIWDLSAFSRVEAIVTNSSEVPIPVSLRVDNPGHWKDEPWNTESIRLDPGERRKLVVFFDHSYGFQPGFDLDPAKVRQLLFFTEGAERARGFTIESVRAAGRAGETPADWQRNRLVVPVKGRLLGESAVAGQVSVSPGATDEMTATGLRIRFDESGQEARFQPAEGAWNLADFFQVAVTVRNVGSAAIQPALRLTSASGSTAIVFPAEPVAPGASSRVVIPFSAAAPWLAGISDKDAPFVSREVEAVVFLSGEVSGTSEFEVTEIVAETPPVPVADNRATGPPVPGEWELTLEEEFDGEALDTSLWNVHTENYWDKRSHFSRDNVLVGEGVARLRFERKNGRHNDDPAGAETDYATGFLDTFGKWTQRYGYFEARMKLPTAPGLWPAFWMMPDRGPAEAPRWKREQTT